MWKLALLVAAAAGIYGYFKLRPMLANHFPFFFAKLDAWEITLWRGSRTILTGRLITVATFVLGINDSLAASGLDVTPIVAPLLERLPETYRPLALPVVGLILNFTMTHLRKITAPLPDADQDKPQP